MEVVIRLVDRGLRKNRSQHVALNAAYSAKHADVRHSLFCQSPFTPDRLHGSFLWSRLMRRSRLLCAMGRSVQAMMRIAVRSERRASLRFHPK